MSKLPDYAELHCLSSFSFLRGASLPAELIQQAAQRGYRALAITDECSLAGIVQAWQAQRELEKAGIPAPQLIIGSEFRLACGLRLVLLACNREGYGNLSALITLARRRSEKGSYRLLRGDLEAISPSGAVPDCLALWLPGEESAEADGHWLKARFPRRLWIAAELLCGADDAGWLARLRALGAACELPLVAAGDVHMHARSRRALQDTLTAIRLRTPLFEAGKALFPNAERHLRTRLRLARLYPPALLAETLKIAALCRFSPAELRYEYPQEVVPPGHTPTSWLRAATEEGLARRYPQGVPAKVRAGVEKELSFIASVAYEPFFLTVYDIVLFARSRGILCQGRGSAANSTVCYALGITEVDPMRAELLFERFLSKERDEPPDIDVDFEHERREEVIQYIYGKYGRERAALAASVICYRTKSALRDVGVALGFGEAEVSALTSSLAWWDKREELPERLAAIGLNPTSPRVARWLALAEQLRGFPRHLSQHVGGFVISRGPLARLVPVENAAMAERSVIQWDKDDLEALGLLKVDVLALGMLTVIRKALDLVAQRRGVPFGMSDIPEGDRATYEMLSRADSIGVFQVESRAQMSMLPRLKPRQFYDLVVQVAIVRPGPIQGDMVHPYLRRREGKEAVARISPEIDAVLSRTYGVPIFQEQVMQLAIVAAGFTPGEADQLRRAMASWKQKGHVERFKDKLRAGMHAKGHPAEFADALCRQIEGFGEYGFPESHAASFALLAYVSGWLKRHEPEAFLCALLDSQPMGFYAPAQLLQDARRHGVTVLPVDVNVSAADCMLEPCAPRRPAVRLGLLQVAGLSFESAQAIVAARAQGAFRDVADLAARAGLEAGQLRRLAEADALAGLSGHRRDAAWQVSGLHLQHDLFETVPAPEALVEFVAPSVGQNLVADYASLGMSLRAHPLSLLRERLAQRRFLPASAAMQAGDRALARVAGIVTSRQKPGSAKSVFVTLEDETGMLNVIVHPWLAERQRRELLGARLLGVFGQLQSEGGVVHLIAKRLVDLTPWLGRLDTTSRDFH
ncbi:error-prone DNA polymerase [Uliginosibacterium flavum]|uniref:Error-prone DNA polymerase n=1 Tax=Uliginosibacterium flavum TaxID=1396831 RepID=A0ABV2TIL9_9RHOO